MLKFLIRGGTGNQKTVSVTCRKLRVIQCSPFITHLLITQIWIYVVAPIFFYYGIRKMNYSWNGHFPIIHFVKLCVLLIALTIPMVPKAKRYKGTALY